jgi:tetratricopeptide (TPR) repeat protein
LLTTQERLAEAAQLIRTLRDDHVRLSSELQQLAARITYSAGDVAQALVLAREAIPENSTDPAQLVLLGQFRWANDLDAEPIFRRAIRLDSGNVKGRLALIVFLASTGKTAQAEAALREAEAALPADRAMLVLAGGHEALGHLDQAAACYRKALAAHPDDMATIRAVADFSLRSGRRDEATPLLERIGQRGEPADAAKARRTLAVIAASKGDPQGARKALELLASGRTPADDRARAKILSLQPARARHREAIALLEGLVTRHVNTPADIALLAYLHETDGDWPKARDRHLELVAAQPKDPLILVMFILALIRNGQADEANAYLARLEPLVAGQPLLLEARARCLVARGKAPEAVAQLVAYAQADARQLKPVASLLEELHQLVPAEQMLRQFVAAGQAKDPTVVLTLAAFLGRHGRMQEALDVLEPLWTTCPIEAVSGTAVLALFEANTDRPELIGRVARQLEKACREHPGRLALEFHLANVRILQERYDDAESIYRAAYKRDQTAGACLNNLAILLALRGGHGSEALSLAQQAIDLDGEKPDFLDTRALAYLAAGQPGPAVNDLENAVAVGPAADKYYHLAQAYQANHQTGDAVRSMRRAQELGLTVQMLHPLERAAFNRIVTELATN